jgi:hypothetical protein
VSASGLQGELGVGAIDLPLPSQFNDGDYQEHGGAPPAGLLTASRTALAIVIQAEIRGGLDAELRPIWSAAPTLIHSAATNSFTP